MVKLQILSAEGAKWQGWCEHRLVALNMYRQNLNLGRTSESRVRAVRQNYELPDNIRAMVLSSDICDIIRIMGGGIAGVIFHPRSGLITQLPYTQYLTNDLGVILRTFHAPGVIGGWREGTELLSTQYIFPLDDADDASFVLTEKIDEVISGEFADSLSLYGNIYWSNGAETADKLVALSWRGTPTRHFRLPSDTDLPGFSTLEDVTQYKGEDFPRYSAFGTALYQGGNVLDDAPRYSWPNAGGPDRCLILGAAENANGTIYMVTLSNRRNSLVGGQGYHLMLWKPSTGEEGLNADGWQAIYDAHYPDNGLPWFPNSDGSAFICGNGDKLDTEGNFTPVTPYRGNYNETILGPGLVSFDANYSGANYFEYQGQEQASSTITATFAASSSATSEADTFTIKTGKYPIVTEAEPDPPAALTITGPEEWTGNIADYSVVTSPFGPGGQYIWTAPTGCGMQNVMCIGSCPDGSKSQAATMSVRMPGGQWQLASDTTYGDTSESEIWEQTSGNTKTVEYITHGCNKLGVGQYTNACLYIYQFQYTCVNVDYLSAVVHGPYPEPTVPYTKYNGGVCDPFAQGHILKCNPYQGDPCPSSASGGYYDYYYQVENTYYGNVMRRIIYTWVC